MAALNRSMWSHLLAVGLPFYRSEARKRALGGLAILVLVLLAVNGMNVVNSYVGRDFMTALAQRQAKRFFIFAGILTGVFAVSTVVEVLSRYAEQLLGLNWRKWLTQQLLGRYLAGRTYLRLVNQHEIDNPDERISLDVQTFTTTTLSIAVMVFNGVVTLMAFSWVLWSITPWLFVASLGYAAIGCIGTILLGRRLVALNNQQIQREADFRYALGRLREHAEEVAQVAGEQEQKSRLVRRLERLVDNFRAVIRVGRNLGFFITGFKYMPQLIPVVIVAPLYIHGTVEFGAVTQAAMAFAQVQGAFAILETQYQDLTTYAAVIGRLGALWQVTEPEKARPTPVGPLPRLRASKDKYGAWSFPAVTSRPIGPVVETATDALRVVYDDLTLWTLEEHRPLVQDLTLEATQGSRLAIVGPNGAGKAILLATAGLWQEGRGRIKRPGPSEVMFVPQQPYAASGKLRDILLDGLNQPIADDRLHAVLDEVRLDQCVARQGGVDVEKDWPKVFSAGELQALTFARLLLANPRFAFLDNPSAGIDPKEAERLYEALAKSPITYVSAGCPQSLLRFHDLRLELHNDGTWKVEATEAQHSADDNAGRH